jgi:hypothetical protein
MGAIGGMVRQGQVNQQQSNFNSQLAGGVRNGSINRDEFMALEKFDQQTHQLEGQFLKDGQLSSEEKRMLDSRMLQSKQMMNNYTGGDFHPFTAGPRNQLDARRDSQLLQTYSGIRDGSLAGPGIFSRDEGARALDGIGNVSTARGKGAINLPFGGHVYPDFNRMLDGSQNNINNLRNNWRNSPPTMMPYNHSWGPHFGGSGYAGSNEVGHPPIRYHMSQFEKEMSLNNPSFGINPFSPFGMNPFSPFGMNPFSPFGGMMGMGMNFNMSFNMGM